jgi:hypothetical protein
MRGIERLEVSDPSAVPPTGVTPTIVSIWSFSGADRSLGAGCGETAISQIKGVAI